MKKLLAIAAMVYLVIAPFTYHPDTKLTLLYASLNGGRVWNVYDFLEKNKLSIPDFHYPPVNYWMLKAEWPLVRLVGGSGIEGWLRSGSNEAVASPLIYRYNLASKFPLIALVLLAGWILYQLGKRSGLNDRNSRLMAALWLFNPVTLYSGVMMGQNDILAILPFLLGLVWYYEKPWLAFLWFGFGGAIKTFPLIWGLILGLAYPSKSWVKRIVFALIPLAVYVGTLMPYIGTKFFRDSVLYSGLATRMFATGLDIGFGERILIVPLLLLLVTAVAVIRMTKKDYGSLSILLLVVNMVILGFSHFHPQWFVWLVPFWAMWMVLTSSRENIGYRCLLSLLVFLAYVLVVVLFEDKFLYWGIVASSNPGLLNLPFLGTYLSSRGIQVELLNNLGHSLLAGMAILSVGGLVWGRVTKNSQFLLRSKLQINKLTATVIAMVIIFGLIFVPKLVPSLTFDENGNANAMFRRMDGEHLYKQSWSVKGANINRVEVLLKNPGLQSKDNFKIVVMDNLGKLVAEKEGNAVNIGDPGYFRIDWPAISDSSGKLYSLEIVPTKVDGWLEVGFNNDGQMVFREYYLKKSGIGTAIWETFEMLVDLVKSQTIVLILPIVPILLL